MPSMAGQCNCCNPVGKFHQLKSASCLLVLPYLTFQKEMLLFHYGGCPLDGRFTRLKVHEMEDLLHQNMLWFRSRVWI